MKKMWYVIALLFALVCVLTACNNSSESDSAPETLPHEHTWSLWYTVEEPDCMNHGLEKRSCGFCDAEQSNVIPARAHLYGEWSVVKEATCTEKGEEKRTCACGKEETRDITSSHSYVNGVCIVCSDVDEGHCAISGMHTYVEGKCARCSLKVYDVLKNYILENGEIKSSSRCYSVTLGNVGDEYYTFLWYYPEEDRITFNFNYNYKYTYGFGCIYAIEIHFTPYSYEDGGYEYSARCRSVFCSHPTIRGFMDPSNFSSSTQVLPGNNSGTDEARAVEIYNIKAVKENIKLFLIPFLETLEANISIKDLGFVRFG